MRISKTRLQREFYRFLYGLHYKYTPNFLSEAPTKRGLRLMKYTAKRIFDLNLYEMGKWND